MAANSIAKRKITRAAPIGDERATSGSPSELAGMLRELEAILTGASALVESDELNSNLFENPIAAAAELLKLALVRCIQLGELIEPEAANG